MYEIDTTVLSKLKQNRQYFYIRLMDIQYKDTQEKVNAYYSKNKSKTRTPLKFDIQFQMSNKTSKTTVRMNSLLDIEKSTIERFQKQSHLFCYQAEEILNISLTSSVDQNVKDFKDLKKRKVEEGYTRVLVTPFVALPYTRHKVKANLYKRDEDKKVYNVVVATLKLEIYFLLKFQAELEIYPFEGDFQRSAPVLGETRLGCRFTLNNQRLKSIIEQQGGIHPKWHEYALAQTAQKKTYNDQKFKLVEKNLLKFKLNSVGHTLKIDVINYPDLDKDAELVGSTQIKIESEDFLRFPNQQITKYTNKRDTNETTNKIIKLAYLDPITKKQVEAGTIVIGIRFIYDVQAIQKLIEDPNQDEIY